MESEIVESDNVDSDNVESEKTALHTYEDPTKAMPTKAMPTKAMPAGIAFVDDDSWAQPRSTAGRGWKVFAAILSALIAALLVFTAGTRFGRSRASSSGGVGAAFGRGAGFGLGGQNGALPAGGAPTAAELAAAFGPGARATPTASAVDPGVEAAGSSVRGSIESIAADSIVIRTADGTTVTIAVPEGTQIGKRSAASAADLAVGAEVEIVKGDGDAATSILTGELLPGPIAAPAETQTDPGLGGLLPG